MKTNISHLLRILFCVFTKLQSTSSEAGLDLQEPPVDITPAPNQVIILPIFDASHTSIRRFVPKLRQE